MKIIFDSKTKSIVQFEKGDEPIALLTALAEERDLSFFFSMIGGCTEVELAYYDIDTKAYASKTHSARNIEVITITGNVAWVEGKAWVHAHGVFGNDNHECFGGHINRLTISATGETSIDWIPKRLEKRVDTVSGLKLFCEL
jgi:predicted DNA-binding protein with PD1-like motif